MELNVTSDKENKLLGRREISASATYTEKTPTRDEIKEELCKKLSLNPALVEIREIKQQYGLRYSQITAYSYPSKEAMEKLIKVRGKKGAKPQEKTGATANPTAQAAAPAADAKAKGA